MNRIVVFVSSEMDELQYEREIAREVIEELRHRADMFELWPAMSESPAHASTMAAAESDLFVLILGCDYSEPTFAEYKAAVDHQVPVIVMVRLTSKERDSRVQQFINELEGKGHSGSPARYVYKKYGTLRDFKDGLIQALVHETGRALRPPLYTLTRQEMYLYSAEIIEGSERRLAVVQRTPSLFLGARPYPKKQKLPHEQRFLKALDDWIKGAVNDEKRSLIYAYSAEDTSRCIHEEKIDAVAFTAAFNKYKDIEEASSYRLCFRPLRSTFSGPLVVGDDRVGFWLLGEDQAVSIHQENPMIAAAVIRLLKLHTNDLPRDKALGQVLHTRRRAGSASAR